jgi:glycine betaine/proline transport system ATP-binding protein
MNGATNGQGSNGQAASQARPIKLSCRNVWKVYGPDPAGVIGGVRLAATDRAETRGRLKESRHLGVPSYVRFDVHGEISSWGSRAPANRPSSLPVAAGGPSGHPAHGEDLLRASARLITASRAWAWCSNFGLPRISRCWTMWLLRIRARPSERHARARDDPARGLQGREASPPPSALRRWAACRHHILAVGPELWFLDEPFSALDPLIRRQMQDEFLRLQQMLNKTIVFITHDIIEAFRLADRIAIMREGEVIQIGRPVDIVLNPADDYVAEFTEDVPLLRVLTVRELMEEGAAPLAAGGEKISAATALEALVPRLAAGVPAFAVMDEEGRQLGTLKAAAALEVLARDGGRRRERA